MSEPQPDRTDAILGGKNLPPVNAAVLGGTIGKNRKLAHEFGWSYELVEELSKTHDVVSFETETVNERGEIISRVRKKAFQCKEDLGNGKTMEMIYIPAGNFLMGFEKVEQELVNVPSFHMSKYPITQEQYQTIIGTNPSYFNFNYLKRFASTDLRRHMNSNKFPVEQIHWSDTQEFCSKLSRQTVKDYKLSTEIQWEYACRAGTTTPFHFGDTITTNLANYFGGNGSRPYANEPIGVYRSQTITVGTFQPNNFGLYDMHGNVCEWCEDSHPGKDKGQQPSYPVSWDGEEKNNFLKGGGWNTHNTACTSAGRCSSTAMCGGSNIGFRVVY